MNKKIVSILILLVVSVMNVQLMAETSLILLDLSGSMDSQLNGKNKEDEAKRVIEKTFIPNLVKSGKTALWSFGGECSSIRSKSQFSNDRQSLLDDLQKIGNSGGATPLSFSIERALEALKQFPEPRNLIVVTDGIESCGGDPCGSMNNGDALNANIKVHTIGLGMSSNSSSFKVLECMTQSGAPGGTTEAIEPGASPEKFSNTTQNIVKTIKKQDGHLLLKIVDSMGVEISKNFTAKSLISSQVFNGISSKLLPLPEGKYHISGNLPKDATIDIKSAEITQLKMKMNLGRFLPRAQCGGDLSVTVFDTQYNVIAVTTIGADKKGIPLKPGDYYAFLPAFPQKTVQAFTIVQNRLNTVNLGKFGSIRVETNDATGKIIHLPLNFFDDATNKIVGTGETNQVKTFPAGTYNVSVSPDYEYANQFEVASNLMIQACQESHAVINQMAAIKVCQPSGIVIITNDNTGESIIGNAQEIIGVIPGRYNVELSDTQKFANVFVEHGVYQINCP